MTVDERKSRPAGDDPAQLPSFPEQLSTQLGGWRGMVESAIPITIFVVANLIWGLQPALIGSIGVAVVIAVVRLAQRRPIRYAVNGLFGIALGAVIAWRSGEARDFYLPGILVSYGYAAGMLLSVAIRHPLVGWLWSVLFTQGRSDWRKDRVLMRTFIWLTLLWAAVWIVKVSIQAALYLANEEHLLGIARLLLGAPPYALLLVFTIWVVRRVQRRQAESASESEPESGSPGLAAAG
ncbi:DUF3159 domain-containing protein [Natronosporangium hydrolyticum]|uniref:DUF3159 domain-containing protein n=1 Tax=Natronosporangium hydrolyticum TaxID=2811111 RepID=UPI001EFA1DDE|nr:DUF3159 domain-containing protein [Natronosporangium hydrolyticum]